MQVIIIELLSLLDENYI